MLIIVTQLSPRAPLTAGKERTEAARDAAREFVYQYLLSHPCEVCGEADRRVLGFHHVGAKVMAITRMVRGRLVN